MNTFGLFAAAPRGLPPARAADAPAVPRLGSGVTEVESAPEFLNALLGALGVQPPNLDDLDPSAITMEAETVEAERFGAEAWAIDRDMDRLAPEFRDRLERVIDRMRAEYGHEVRLVEGYREQGRQDALFEQGRSAPGRIVTWTRDSAHSHGLAADLLVDGSYDNAEGYARLARIAEQEGLRTLARDAGHIELPRELATGGQPDILAARAQTAELGAADGTEAGGRFAHATRIARVAQVAEVARVAPVARVAEVARVAPVAQVGEVAPAEVDAGAELAAAEAEIEPRAAAAAGALDSRVALDDDAGGAGRRGRGARARAEAKAERVADAYSGRGAGLEGEAGQPGTGGVGTRGTGTAAGGLSAAGAPDAAGRAERVLEAQEAIARQPLSRVMLRLDEADGGAGRVRIDLRGTRVDADIQLMDSSAAMRLNERMGELHEALTRRGLDPELLRAHASSSGLDSSDALRAAVRAWEPESVSQLMRATETGRDEAADDRRGDNHDPDHGGSGSNGHSSRRERNEREAS